MKHDLYDRDDGLAHCKVCRGAEASLPLECPGRAMPQEEQDAVQSGALNFYLQQWWVSITAAGVLAEPHKSVHLGDDRRHFICLCPDCKNKGTAS